MANFSHPFNFSLPENWQNSHYPQSILIKKEDVKLLPAAVQTEAAMVLMGDQATRMSSSASQWQEPSGVRVRALSS